MTPPLEFPGFFVTSGTLPQVQRDDHLPDVNQPARQGVVDGGPASRSSDTRAQVTSKASLLLRKSMRVRTPSGVEVDVDDDGLAR